MSRIVCWLLSLFQPAPPPSAAPPPTEKTDQFSSCVDWVLQCEGGYVDNPADPGGVTNMGITMDTLSHHIGRQATVVDMHVMTRQTAEDIYFHEYWHANRCDEMPPGVNLVMLDCVVMSSPVRARKWLQAAVGAAQDGIVGEDTMGRLARANPTTVVTTMSGARLNYYQSLSTWDTFGKGWRTRVDNTRARALRMVG